MLSLRSEKKQREHELTGLRPLLFINAYICTPVKVMNMNHLTKEQRHQIKATSCFPDKNQLHFITFRISCY
jgi:hypothetical protein